MQLTDENNNIIPFPTERWSVRHLPYFRTYRCWISMKDRCYRKKATDYQYYGGRGIKVCDRWKNNFLNFLEDMGLAIPGFTLDRIDNNGNYSKENCRWSTSAMQQKNLRSTVIIEYKGEKYSKTDFIRKFPVTSGSLKKHKDKFPLEMIVEGKKQIREKIKEAEKLYFRNLVIANRRKRSLFQVKQADYTL